MEKAIATIANELRSWLESAVSDMAGNESEADELYEDVGVIKDLIGDRIYDDCGGDLDLMVGVAGALCDSKYTGKTLKQAAKEKKTEWSMRALKRAEYGAASKR